MLAEEKGYGYAMFSLAKEENLEDDFFEKFQTILKLFKENDGFLQTLSSKRITKSQRIDIVDKTFSKAFHTYFCSFLKLCIEHDKIDLFEEYFLEFRKEYYADKGILEVKAITAIPLSKKQLEVIKNNMEKKTGKPVVISNHVDKSCIGGLRLEYEGSQLDYSVQSKLERIHDQLKQC